AGDLGTDLQLQLQSGVVRRAPRALETGAVREAGQQHRLVARPDAEHRQPRQLHLGAEPGENGSAAGLDPQLVAVGHPAGAPGDVGYGEVTELDDVTQL